MMYISPVGWDLLKLIKNVFFEGYFDIGWDDLLIFLNYYDHNLLSLFGSYRFCINRLFLLELFDSGELGIDWLLKFGGCLLSVWSGLWVCIFLRLSGWLSLDRW